MGGERPLRVLVVSAVHPVGGPGVTQAAEMATWEIVHRLAADNGCEVVYGLVSERPSAETPATRACRAALEAKGVRFLPPVTLEPFPPYGGATYHRHMLAGDKRALLRGWGQSADLAAAVRTLAPWEPDTVLPVWSYEATYAAAGLPYPLCQFHGNPDHKLIEAANRIAWRWERSASPKWWLVHGLNRVHERILERVHRAVLAGFPLIWENAANDVAYYHAKGMTNVHYLRNMWTPPEDDACLAERDALEQDAPLKICGNMGHLGATANTFGLWAIGEEIMPALRRRLGDGGFEMHIYGRPPARGFLDRWLNAGDRDLRMRGFVDDIEREMKSCPVFLLANNRFNFKVGHTRILHAFATGACIVAYRDTALAMPELKHDENILLGDSGEDLAELMVEAGRDRALRRRIGRGGLKTLRTLFHPRDQVATMAGDMRRLIFGDGA
jgi:hypothetical protein